MTRRAEKDGYAISTIDSNHPLAALMPGFGPEMGTETALIVGDKYYILNGDWHDRFEACKSLDEAMALYEANQEHKSGWSSSEGD